MRQESGNRPNGAAAVIHAVYGPRGIRNDHYEGNSLWWRGRRRHFERQCSRGILVDSSLKTELPGVLMGVYFGANARQGRQHILESQTGRIAVPYKPTRILPVMEARATVLYAPHVIYKDFQISKQNIRNLIEE